MSGAWRTAEEGDLEEDIDTFLETQEVRIIKQFSRYICMLGRLELMVVIRSSS